MTSTIQLLVVLLGVVAAVAVLATRLKTPASILLVLTGVALALIPGLPSVELAPEAVLLLVLPPVIYASAVAMSWREFRFNLRPIAMLAVGCVLFTTAGVAVAAHWLLGLSWPVGSYWARSSPRPIQWRLFRSPAGSRSQGAFSSSSKEK